jgi:nucleoside-diphosphate-sugar epimerase
VTRFNVDRDLARSVNVDGSRQLFELARRCPRLERVAFVSTLYAAGLAAGPVAEAPLDGPRRFANHYEWSKWEAERLLAAEYADLPWRIYRVATAIADDDSGRVVQHNAFHGTLKLFFYGLLSLVPGDRETPLPFVTGAFAAGAIRTLLDAPDADHGVYHVCPPPAQATPLGALIDAAFDRFEREPDYRARRLLRPLFCDAEAFALLAEGIDSFGGAVVNDGLRSVTPFAPQLFAGASKAFATARLAGALGGAAALDPVALIARTCDHLVGTRWGRKEGAGAGAAA